MQQRSKVKHMLRQNRVHPMHRLAWHAVFGMSKCMSLAHAVKLEGQTL